MLLPSSFSSHFCCCHFIAATRQLIRCSLSTSNLQMKHSTASCNSFIFFSFIFIYSHSFFALAIFIFHLMQAPHMIASTDTKILNAKAFICLGAQHLSGRPFLSGCIGSKLKSKFRCCWWFHDKMCHIWNLSCFEKFQLFTKCSKFYGKRMKIIQKKNYAAQKPH